MDVRPASCRMFRSSDPLYLARPPNPESAYPTGEHNSTVWNPAAESCLSVPGKSFAIISRTGQVWHPRGKPRGLARSMRPPFAITVPNTALDEAALMNFLLDICDTL